MASEDIGGTSGPRREHMVVFEGGCCVPCFTLPAIFAFAIFAYWLGFEALRLLCAFVIIFAG